VYDSDPARSDADILVAFDKEANLSARDQFLGFAEAPEEILGRRVHLIERGALKTSRTYIRRRNILADAEVLYG
jgi:predicted nucleotidyltransferase